MGDERRQRFAEVFSCGCGARCTQLLVDSRKPALRRGNGLVEAFGLTVRMLVDGERTRYPVKLGDDLFERSSADGRWVCRTPRRRYAGQGPAHFVEKCVKR